MFYLGTPSIPCANKFLPFPISRKKAEKQCSRGAMKKAFDIIPLRTAPNTFYGRIGQSGMSLNMGDEYRMLFSASTDLP